MFKEAYKRANDSIPTQDAKKRVMDNLKNPPAAKSPYRKITEAAALAACLVFTFAAVSAYNRFESGRKKDIIWQYTAENVNSVNTNPTEKDDEYGTAGTAENADSSYTAHSKSGDAEREKKSTAKAASPKQYTSENKNIPSEKNEPVKETASSYEDNTPVSASFESKTEISVNHISGASPEALSAVYAAREITPKTEITVGEYYEYLGKNIEESVSVPENFENMTQETAYFEINEDGIFKNDEWNFIFAAENGSVEITTSKNTEKIDEYIGCEDYAKSTVSGKEAVVTESESVYGAYMTSGEVGYSITAFGIDEAQLEELLVSLAD